MIGKVGEVVFSLFRTIPQRCISSKACFGAGCYWGTEKYFHKDFNSLHPASNLVGKVGFMSSIQELYENPTYEEVCSGKTSLVEVYQMGYLESKKNEMEMYKRLVWHYFSFHDPTTSNRQGLDCGPQYASTIFYYNDQQRQIAEEVIQKLQSFLDLKQSNIRYVNRQVLTSLIEASTFYPAEEAHQEYLQKNPGGYCNHYYRFDWSQLIK